MTDLGVSIKKINDATDTPVSLKQPSSGTVHHDTLDDVCHGRMRPTGEATSVGMARARWGLLWPAVCPCLLSHGGALMGTQVRERTT